MAKRNTKYRLTDNRYMGEMDFLIEQLKVEDYRVLTAFD